MSKKSESTLKTILSSGGEIKADAHKLEEVAALAEEMGLTFYAADCDKARNRSAILRALSKAVDYPVFFGNNMDALLDCLGETLLEQKKGMVLWIENLHSGDPSLVADTQDILGILNDTLEYATDKERVFVYAIEHVGKHSDPEPGVAPAPYAESQSK
ncbi:barstar family protein [Advenella sp. WQ 585]|uniref:Barstar family protein n=1 Tax=Advenella mandrilli TaxID=2800330 RepID=A0ABS1EDX7_9BURK|nr:barstar family protein [Advenella mandrilli]MBK1780341.1 barstar family protein [Advenella mandrilli]